MFAVTVAAIVSKLSWLNSTKAQVCSAEDETKYRKINYYSKEIILK